MSEPDAGQNLLIAGKAPRAFTVRAPRLTDGPQQARLHRINLGIEFMAIEAETRLQAQGVTGAQADRLHLLKVEDAPGQGIRCSIGYGDLEAVLAGVTGAGDVYINTIQTGGAALHKHQLRRSGAQGLHHISRLWALQCQ